MILLVAIWTIKQEAVENQLKGKDSILIPRQATAKPSMNKKKEKKKGNTIRSTMWSLNSLHNDESINPQNKSKGSDRQARPRRRKFSKVISPWKRKGRVT